MVTTRLSIQRTLGCSRNGRVLSSAETASTDQFNCPTRECIPAVNATTLNTTDAMPTLIRASGSSTRTSEVAIPTQLVAGWRVRRLHAVEEEYSDDDRND